VIDASVLIFVPIVGAVVIGILPLSHRAAAYLSVLVALGVVGGVAGLVYRFEPDGGLQFEDDVSWIPDLGIRYHVAVDGLTLAMMAMTALVIACMVGYAMWDDRGRTRLYFALLLGCEGALLLLFCARDLVLFYVGFEAMLIPLYFLIGVWGGENRGRATLKFIIYTSIGTLLMLIGILTLGLSVPGGPSFAYSDVAGSNEDWIFLTFILAFFIKCPVWPFHGWVPDAYRTATPEVAAGLSGLASKAGAYALIAIVLPIFPGPSADWRWPLIALATTGLLYGSYLAFRQPDSRGVIAYSSIGQMGLIVLGIFVLNDQGATGAAFAMVNHALLSAALFLLAGWVERTVGTGDFRMLGGLARGRPVLATICIIVGVCALAVPGSATFASEFLILLGAFQAAWWLGTIASVAIVLAAMYMLRWISAILHDREGVAVGEHRPHELAPGAFLAIAPLVIAILALSVWPFGLTELVDPTTTILTQSAAQEVDAP
jgi:NADH-quinone oxidoreductase subunit M